MDGFGIDRGDPPGVMFQSLDFLYVPSRHPDREIAYYTEVLGGTLLFRVKGMGTEVSAVRLSEEGRWCSWPST